MRLSDFHYELDPGFIATEPVSPRDAARLLVCTRAGRLLEHAHVRDLPRFLRPGDRLVLNETKVLPHRLHGRRASGGRVQCLLLERDGAEAEAFLRPSPKLRPGERLRLEGDALELEIVAKLGRGKHRVRLRALDGELDEVLERVGRAPLPPYIERDPEHEDTQRDRERYQTVFAREPGAVAAPTAGLHLTRELLAGLQDAGIGTTRVVLHVGEGTFAPVRTQDIAQHEMHEERYVLTAAAAAELDACKAAGGRVVCVGTTAARVLESCFDGTRLVPGEGRTRLFLYPGRGPRYLDGLMTNFHLPESTLLMLVASLLGRDEVLGLYEEAKRRRYRFFSFGDAMLILP